MRPNTEMNAIVKTAALAGMLLAWGVPSAAPVDVYLQAVATSEDLLNTTTDATDDVPMWRYVCDAAAATTAGSDNPACDGTGSGSAQIRVAVGDDVTIYVSNTLPIETSVIIPGQAEDSAGAAGDVQFFNDGQGRSRVKSFTHETGVSSSNTYVFSAVHAGTYLYQSGTYPSIQVPMGLYGAFVVDGPATTTGGPCTAGQPAYDDLNSCYDSDVVLLFSEVDPAQNAAVAAAGGTVANWPSTVNYNPTYLLINGETSADLSAIGNSGGKVLLRMANAGSRAHTPAIVGVDMSILGEDGNLYPGNPLVQAQALLPAGKTSDAIVTLAAGDNTFALFDRTPEFTNDDLVQQGGLKVSLDTGAGATVTPDSSMAADDTYAVTEDTALVVPAGTGVLVNDCDTGNFPPCSDLSGAAKVSAPSNGTLNLNADGSFTYTPNPDFSGTDGFTYSATAGGNIYSASVTLNVSFVNDAPTAVADGPYSNSLGNDIVVDAAHGVLGNDSDPDGDHLTAVIDGMPPPPAGLTLNADGSFTYTGLVDASFRYHAQDEDLAVSDPVQVDLQHFNPSGVTLTVIDADDPAVTLDSYRWIVQEDVSWRIDPNDTTAVGVLDQQSLNFHKSTYPVIAQGCLNCRPDVDVDAGDGTFPNPAAGDVDYNGNGIVDATNDIPFTGAVLDPNKYYYVSVLPNTAGATDTTAEQGHTIGGAQILPGDTAVTVMVNRQEIPTAQISVQVFEDGSPTNGVPDAGEPGLGGFQITLEDAGGRYGASAGIMSQDAFAQPLKNSLPCAPPGTAEGVIVTCADGAALIKDLPPGKYGVIVEPPAAEVGQWIQTSTIEGTKVIDTWVKANEPPFFVEFGAPGPHAFIGFVNPEHTCVGAAPCQVPAGIPAPPGSSSVTGHVTLQHDPRPPGIPGTVDSGSYVGFSHTRAVVGLNTNAGDGPNIATVHADDTGAFTISGIPDGTYQLVVWDVYLDQVISFQTVTLPDDAGDIGNIAVPAWFTRLEHNVFLDANENGVRDDGEAPLPEQNINVRWRDGTVFQAFPTDGEGFVPFDQLFPFFNWQVAEVDYARMKPTGLTVTVDGGGDTTGSPYPGLLSLQADPRTELGPVLTEAFQNFPGQTTIFDWGKVPWQPGENGGISGIVYYANTRGEENPQLTAGDPWEPGIPNVTVRLYREIARDPAKVDIDVDLTDGPFPQPGDTDVNGNGIYDGPMTLMLVQEAQSDSWDANLPTGCPGEDTSDPFSVNTLTPANIDRCYDGWRNWNQARPGVFDGGYAFNDIPAGNYVVEVVLPPGYELYKEQDMNVGFGDSYGPNNTLAAVSITLPNGMLGTVIPDQAMIAKARAQNFEVGIAQPPCVGDYHRVPAELSLFPGEPAPFADSWRPLCDRKRVVLEDQSQAAADFHLFTSTPVATQYTGLVTDDISNETDPNSPNYGEKWTPAFLPFAIRDFNGHEVYRGYGDAFGHYNGLAPSTFSAHIPVPSGFSPAMHLTCLNDPGDGPTVDSLHLNSYGNPCYTLQFMPGTTTYLDTPILPTAAFAAGFNPADCAAPARTPTIASVVGPGGVGPLVPSTGGDLTITSHGMTTIPNPDYEGPLGTTAATITRDLGFGAGGTVTLNGVAVPATWDSNTQITATVPAGLADGAYQLAVTRSDGTTSVNAVTVTKGGSAAATVPGTHSSIQAAINAVGNGDLILVGPGTYEELVIMPKPVRLQGVGTDTTILAVKRPQEKVQTWINDVTNLFESGAVDPLPNQADFTLDTEQGAGITVLSKMNGSWTPGASRIDGFTITGAELGGGIYVNGYADYLQISNNNVTGNSGFAGGGIRIGRPFLAADGNGPFAFNTNVKIHHNAITSNGANSFESAGGGISLNRGSDGYEVSNNFICGNYTAGDGGGIGHLGLSDNGDIQSNTIVFNQSLNNSFTPGGGGIFVGGEPGQPPALTLGAGDVTIDGNVIKGNHAASGHGGGIRTQFVNGSDVSGPGGTNPMNWYRVQITNNMIVNNVAGWSGAGIALQDTVNAFIVLNTIANNDSTATVGAVLGAGGTSTPQPAGISSALNSLGLNATIPGDVPPGPDPRNPNMVFSNPKLTHNIIWHNRAFSFDGTQLQPVLAPGATGGCAAGANYVDLGVLDPGYSLIPENNIMTVASGSNVSVNPDFLSEYCNGSRILSTPGPMLATAAFAEGGNFVDVRYGPLTQAWDTTATPHPTDAAPWDYHLGAASGAIDRGFNTGNSSRSPSVGRDHDIDGESRPFDYPGVSVNPGAPNRLFDLGADEARP